MHLDMEVKLEPKDSSIELQVTLPANSDRVQKHTFYLHPDLRPWAIDPSVQLTPCAINAQDFAKCWQLLTFGDKAHTFSIQGVINDSPDKGYSRGFIDTRGAILLGNTYWYPVFENTLVTYNLKTFVPEAWQVINQGQRQSETLDGSQVFAELNPQEAIHLMAGPFYVYTAQNLGVEFNVYLQTPDKKLAQKYLDLLPDYTKHYSELIGPYPYTHFSVVENFWPTGYGLPAATLLGSQVMRLPFILTSSLPHEVLHNWWGNSVYIDDSFGNWAEGLTTYMSDHWIQEQKSEGYRYRLNALLQYQDYHMQVPEEPLASFKYRHSNASQALGYSKGLMFFHMLKVRLGEEVFYKGLSELLKDYKYKMAGYPQILQIFEQLSGDTHLASWFDDWLSQVGQVDFFIKDMVQSQSLSEESVFEVGFTLIQNPSPHLFEFELPIVFDFLDGSTDKKKVRIDKKRYQPISFWFDKKVKRLRVDPAYDVFRKVGPLERPQTLSKVYGSPQIEVWSKNNQVTQALHRAWQERVLGALTYKGAIYDSQSLVASDSTASLIVTQGVYEAAEIAEIKKIAKSLGVVFHSDGIIINKTLYQNTKNDWVLVFKDPQQITRPVMWLHLASNTQVSTLAPRLLHYGSMGALVFDGRSVRVQTLLAPQSANQSELVFEFIQN